MEVEYWPFDRRHCRWCVEDYHPGTEGVDRDLEDSHAVHNEGIGFGRSEIRSVRYTRTHFLLSVSLWGSRN